MQKKRASQAMQTPELPADSTRSIIRTKIVAPRYPATLVDRPRLLDRLKAGESRPLTVVEAPAGFGKTALLAQWRKRLLVDGAKVCWLTLDEDDAEIGTALSYLAESLGESLPAAGETLRALLQPGPRLSSETMLSRLVNALAEERSEIFLILDDYHATGGALEEAVSHLVAYAPANFHLVLGTRHASEINRASLRAYDTIVEIGETELRFSLDETRDFVRNLLSEDLPADQIAELHRHTEGWATALQLACLAIRGGRPAADLVDRLAAPEGSVGVFLTEDILSRQPPQIVDFLTATSILERLNGDLCDWVTGQRNASAVLDEVRQANLFLVPYENTAGWYRYHGLFRHFLNERLRTADPDREVALHRRACDWFAREGRTADAVRHAIASGDTNRAMDLVEDCAMDLVQRSHTAQLLTWIGRFDEAQLSARPRLRLAQAWAFALSPHPEQALKTLERLDRDLPGAESPGEASIRREVLVIRALIAGIGDEALEAKRLVETWLDAGPGDDPWPMGVAGNLLSYAHLQTAQIHRVKDIQTRYRRWRSQTYTAAYGDVLQGIGDEIQGRLHDAANRFEEAFDRASQTVGPGSAAATMAAALLGDILFEWGRRQDALALIETRLDVIDEVGLVEAAMAAYRPMIRGRSPEAAREVLGLTDRLERLGRERLGGERLIAMALAERARFLVQRADFINARIAVRELKDLADANPLRAEGGRATEIWERYREASARLDIAVGNPEPATDDLTAAIGLAERTGRYGRLVNLRSLRAAALAGAGQREAARADLLAALAIATPQGYVETLLGQGEAVRTLLAELRDSVRRRGEGACPGRDIRTYLERLLSGGTGLGSSGPTLAGPKDASPDADEPIAADRFTLRQLQILKLLSEGLSNKEIARSLAIGSETVKWHLKAIFARLDVHNRAQAVIKAREHRLVL